LALAKLAYPRVVDPINFKQLYSIFNTTTSRNEMDVFIRNNPNNNTYTGGNNNSSQTAMTDFRFNQLLQTASGQYNQVTRFNTIRNAINTTGNYFSTSQIRQLLNITNAESDRLALAQLAYLKVTDPTSFSTLYDMFSTQASRTELNNYVIQNGGTGISEPTGTKTAMTDYQFNQLLQTANGQSNQITRFNTIRNAINTTGNYFSTFQIRQLLNITNAESDRLALAQLAYLKVTDPTSFTTLYDMFSTQASRTELNNYVIQNGGTGATGQLTTRTPMSDEAYAQVLKGASNHILPWNKSADVKAAFNNTSYYFTTTQIRQLLALVYSETERLSLAKLAWSRVTDPGNFTQLFDMFTVQANKDDLNAYIKARPY
jgi:hypothetical protein